MANDSVRIKRGLYAELPKHLPLGELVFCTDTGELYVGMGDTLPPKKASADIDTEEIGDISNLLTDNKSSLVDAINDLFKKVKYLEENGGMGGNNSAPIISSDFTKTVFSTDEEIMIPFYVTDAEGGKITAQYSINGNIEKHEISLGTNVWKIGKLLRGNYTLRIAVQDRGGLMSNELQFKISVGGLELTTRFDDSADFGMDTNIEIPYEISAVNSNPITVDYVLDGHTTTVDVAKGRNVWNIGHLSKGVHKASILAFNGEQYSNQLNFNLVVADGTSLFISTDFNGSNLTVEDRIVIPYRISLLGGKSFKIHTTINGVPQPTANGVLGMNFWSIGYLNAGNYELTIQAEEEANQLLSNILTLNLNVAQSSFTPVQPIVEDLICWLDASNKSNNLEDKTEWVDKSGRGTRVKLYDLDYRTNGWIDGALKLTGTSYVEVDLQPFRYNIVDGLTFDIEFKFSKVGIEEARVLSCELPTSPFSGVSINTERARIVGQNVPSNEAPLVENEWIRATLVIDKMNTTQQNCLVYINGMITDMIYLNDTSSFLHEGKIYLGCQKLANGNMGNFGQCDIRNFRIYNRPLNHEEVLQNYISDMEVVDQKKKVKHNEGADIPILEMWGNFDGMDADNQVPLRVKYQSKGYGTDLNYDLPEVLVDWQGNSSLQYPIKNYNIDLVGEDGKSYKCQVKEDWPVMDSYHIKANLVDSSHAFNIGIANYLYQVYTEQLPPMKVEGHNARYAIDGFPVLLYQNDKFHGVYTYNLKQHRDVFGMSKTRPNLMYRAEENSANGAGSFNNWEVEGNYGINAEWEMRVPKPQEGETHPELADLIKWVHECANSKNGRSPKEFKDTVNAGNRFNKSFLIDYYILCYAFGMVDSLGKNMTISSWDVGSDGNPLWYPMFYDMDTAFGFTNNGALTWGPDIKCPENYNTNNSALWNVVLEVFKDDIDARYRELRRTRLNADNVVNTFREAIIDVIPEKFYNLDAMNKYLPTGADYVYMCKGNRLMHLKGWLTERFIYMDSIFNYVHEGNRDTVQFRSEKNGDIVLQIKTYSPTYISVDFGGTAQNIHTKLCTPDKYTEFRFRHDGSHKDFSITQAKQLMEVKGFNNLNMTMLNVQYADRLVELDCNNNPKLEGLELGNMKYLRRLNVSNCGFILPNKTVLDLSGCGQIEYINAEGSGITGLNIAKSNYINYLNLKNSKITTLNAQGKSYLKSLYLDGCTVLSDINLNDCSELLGVTLNNSTELSNVKADNCEKMEVFNLAGCSAVENIDIANANKLRQLTVQSPLLTDTSILLTNNDNLETVNIVNASNLRELDLGTSNKMDSVIVQGTAVESIDLKGNSVKGDFRNNPNLEHITNGKIKTQKDMNYRFQNTPNLQEVVEFEVVEKPTTMSYMFNNSGITEMPELDLSEVTNMHASFRDTPNMRGSIRVNAPKLSNLNNIFRNSGFDRIEEFYAPLGDWDIWGTGRDNPPFVSDNLTEARNITIGVGRSEADLQNRSIGSLMFTKCPNLEIAENINLGGAGGRISDVFSGCSKLHTVRNLDISNSTQNFNLFLNCVNMGDFTGVKFNKTKDVSLDDAFNGTQMSEITDNLPLANATSLSRTFKKTNIEVLENITFERATNINRMFEEGNLKTIRNVSFPSLLLESSNFRYDQPFGTKLETIENLRLPKVANFEYFAPANFNLTLRSVNGLEFGTNLVTLSQAFQNCKQLTEVRNFKIPPTDNTVNGNYIFAGCENIEVLETDQIKCKFNSLVQTFHMVPITEIPDWDYSEVTSIQDAFHGTLIEEVNNLVLPKCVNVYNAFRNVPTLKKVDGFKTPMLNFSPTETQPFIWNSPFSHSVNIEELHNIDLGNAPLAYLCSSENGSKPLTKLTKVTNIKSTSIYARNAFSGCTALKSIDGISIASVPIEGYKGNTYGMFNLCRELESISNYHFGELHDASHMFDGCEKLAIDPMTLDIGEHTTSLAFAFVKCKSLSNTEFTKNFGNSTISLDQAFNQSNLTKVSIVAPNCTHLNYAFNGCDLLTEAYLDVENGTKLGNAYAIFFGCTKLKKITIKLNPNAPVEHTRQMFNNDGSFNGFINLEEIDLSGMKGWNLNLNYSTTGINKLKKLFVRNTNSNITLTNQPLMTAQALNDFFTSLKDVRGDGGTAPTLNITGCAGASTCNISIATNKGWNVTR